MFCKWCGGDLAKNDKKCSRCGRAVPAKSDCGGFYDLVPNPVAPASPARNDQPAGPTVIHMDAPKPSPVPLILSIVSLVLILALLLSNFSMCGSLEEAERKMDALEDRIISLEQEAAMPEPTVPPTTVPETTVEETTEATTEPTINYEPVEGPIPADAELTGEFILTIDLAPQTEPSEPVEALPEPPETTAATTPDAADTDAQTGSALSPDEANGAEPLTPETAAPAEPTEPEPTEPQIPTPSAQLRLENVGTFICTVEGMQITVPENEPVEEPAQEASVPEEPVQEDPAPTQEGQTQEAPNGDTGLEQAPSAESQKQFAPIRDEAGNYSFRVLLADNIWADVNISFTAPVGPIPATTADDGTQTEEIPAVPGTITVTVTLDEAVFGATHGTKPLTFHWVSDSFSENTNATEGIASDLWLEEADLAKCSGVFALTITRNTANDTKQKIIIKNIPLPPAWQAQ